ncbi:MAG: hypothetical protein HFF80_10750 [Oscillospiraceae bacterium]|jgi:hypothetical protein|nr:hypothetical protein [Oscillospiraceae bacterium]
MKIFLQRVIEWKAGVCVMYTASMVIYLFFCLVFDHQEVSTTMLWALLLASVLGTLIQAVCFSDWIIKNMRYTWRSLLFCVLFLPTLAVLGWKAQWFPTENWESWALFAGIFFAIFFVMTIGFDIYFRLTGRKYDGLLGQYRRQKEEE